MSMYELAVEPKQLAEAYIQRFVRIAGYISKISPPARVTIKDGHVTLKFTAIGEKWRHHIYVDFIPVKDKNIGVFRVTPPYPMYLLAVMIPFGAISYPALIMRRENEIRGVMIPDYDLAIEVLANTLTKFPLLEPSDFTEEKKVSFEGILYTTPIGYVAFLDDKKPFKKIDVIEAHEEEELMDKDENIMYPVDFFNLVLEKLLKETG